MKNDELIKNRIRNIMIDLRNENNLTQTDVGKIVGKSKTAIASWEQGLSMPDVVTLYQLAKYYGKDLNYMYGTDYLVQYEKDGRQGTLLVETKRQRKEGLP